jgi:hypothetical protein
MGAVGVMVEDIVFERCLVGLPAGGISEISGIWRANGVGVSASNSPKRVGESFITLSLSASV